eukprot:978552-Rhodomonas_salina.3
MDCLQVGTEARWCVRGCAGALGRGGEHLGFGCVAIADDSGERERFAHARCLAAAAAAAAAVEAAAAAVACSTHHSISTR